MYEIKPLDKDAVFASKKHRNSIAKPLNSLGKFEKIITQIAGIQRTEKVDISKRAVLIMCADNGVVSEGVTQTGQDVTAIVTENFSKGTTSVCAMARASHTDIVAVDVGVASDVHGVINKTIMYGTNNMTKMPAMSIDDAKKAIGTGIECVKNLKDTKIIATGEMGIGNTTTSSAVASVLLNKSAEEVTGKGAGLSSDGLQRKINAIKKAIDINRPNPNDVIDVLSKVGGLDIAALCGVFLGGAIYRVPIIIDGFISATAALCAKLIDERCLDFMIASHVSKEGAARHILDELGKSAVIDGDLCLGEGTGGVMLLPMLDTVLAVYNEMATFDDINVEQYEELT